MGLFNKIRGHIDGMTAEKRAVAYQSNAHLSGFPGFHTVTEDHSPKVHPKPYDNVQLERDLKNKPGIKEEDLESLAEEEAAARVTAPAVTAPAVTAPTAPAVTAEAPAVPTAAAPAAPAAPPAAPPAATPL